MDPIRAPKDLQAGIIYLAVAAIFYWIGRDYEAGAASQAGPGYFPMLLCTALALIGLISIIRSFISDGTSIERIAWRPVALVSLAIVCFGASVPTLGLLPSLILLIILSAVGSHDFRFSWKYMAGAIGFSILCALVFVEGLGLPIPIFGSWLESLPYGSIGG